MGARGAPGHGVLLLALYARLRTGTTMAPVTQTANLGLLGLSVVVSFLIALVGGFPGVAWDYVSQDLREKYKDVIPTTIPAFPGGDWEKAINDGWYRNVAPNVDRNA